MRSFTTSNLSNTPSKSFFKPLIAASLALSLSTLNAQNADATATYEYKNGSADSNTSTSTCNAESFPCSNNVFGSDAQKNGQVLGHLGGFNNKNENAKTLEIKLTNGAFLKLDSLGKQAHGNLPIAIFVDNLGSDAKTFTLTSNNSTFVGNIRFYGNNSSTSSTGSNNGSTFKLTYTGNNTESLDNKNILKSQISVKSSDKLTGSYAQVGSIFNHSNSKVEATFSNGAKMYGDIYTATTAKAMTDITFGEMTSTTGTKMMTTDATTDYKNSDIVFEGGIQTNNGSTTLTINKGSANLDSVTFGTFGILAQNNGTNTITLKDGALTASTISANNKGTNTIIIGETSTSLPSTSSPITSSPITISSGTQTNQNTTNFKVTGNIANKNSTNNITINKGSAIIEGYVSSDSDGANMTSNTIKVLESSLTIGKKENNAPGKSIGIISWANSTNTITVGDSGAASNNWTNKIADFNASSSLNVNRIYAASSGSKNLITVDGDLTMQYIDTPSETPNPIISRDALGADILATQGGVNEITILGTLTSKTYTDGTKASTPTNNEYKKLIISSYGAKVTEGMGVSDNKSSESKNIIRILGKGQDSTATVAAGQQAQAAKDADVSLGIIASTAGSNQVIIRGDSTTVANRKNATIDLIYASNRDFLGSLERNNRSGTNDITINNRKTVNINNIITQGDGKNTITFEYSASQITSDQAKTEVGVTHTSGTTKLVYKLSTKAASSGTSELTNQFTLDYKTGYEKYHDAYKKINNGSSLSSIATKLLTSNASNNSSKTLDVTYKGLTIANMDTTESTLTSLKHTIEANSALITDTLATIGSTTTTLVKSDLVMKDGSKIIFNGSTNQIYLKSLMLNASNATENQDLLRDTLALKNTTIDLANVSFDNNEVYVPQGEFKTLSIESLSSTTGNNTLFRLRADDSNADKVSVENLGSSATINVQVFLKDPKLVTHDFSKQDVVVFEVNKKDSGNTNNLTLVSKEAKTGFAIYTLNIEKKNATSTLDANTNTKEQWVISGVSDVRADANAIDHTSAALALGLNIFIDNINSLNKRMGELRDNENNQGVWARIYSGRATNHMQHIPTVSYYTNFQAGYDYAFNPSDAKNYLGAFIQYGYTASKSNGLNSPSLKVLGFSANSNNIDIGIYNSYIANWGLYSDSIFKISTIINDINIESQNTSNTNVGVSLSQEVGYRYKFGDKKEWYVDPQAEFTLGYINQSDIARIDNYGLILDGKLAASLLFRSRVAAHLGYSLETEKAGTYDFRLGLGYVYDVLANGGANFKITSLNYDKTIDALQNDGRMVLNLGTNIRLADNHRIYFDFERSFFGKITTDYLVNIGYRYSFGTKANSEVKTQQISQEIKLKEVAPSSGYYIKALDSKKPSKKEMRILSQIDGIKTQNNGDSKSYLIGPFKSVDEAKGEMNNYEGVLKELKSEGEIIEIE